MATDIIAALKAEKNQLNQRITAIDAALIAYGVSPESGSMPKQYRGLVLPAKTKAERVVEAAETEIRKRGRPITSTELVTLLSTLGIDVGGKDPRNSVSAILSTSKKFKGRRGIGWVLLDMADPSNETSPAKLPGM